MTATSIAHLADPSSESSRPRVSVIVPTFNRAGMLKETVEAILAQTYTDFELIIVDNMSIDGTQTYVTAIADPRVKYFRNANHGVIAANRNFGIRQARGVYVALCDDDDLWLPQKLEKQVHMLDCDQRIGLCYSNASSFDAKDTIDHWMVKKKVFDHHYRHLLIGNFIPNSTVLIRRVFFEQLGYFNEGRKYIAVEDYLMWLMVARTSQLSYLDEPLIRYRIHAAANGGNAALMAKKVLGVILIEHDKNRFSPYGLYVLCRAFIRYAFRKLF